MDEIFTADFIQTLTDGETVKVNPVNREGSKILSGNFTGKTVNLDFSEYSGNVSINCTGFTDKGGKIYSVTGTVSPWIQSETLTTITIIED